MNAWQEMLMLIAALAIGVYVGNGWNRSKVLELLWALPDPDKLDLLADWIDKRFPGDTNSEVQSDLRMWAERIREVQ